MQPVFYVVETFPKLSESFISGKAAWLLAQHIPLKIIDKYPQRREYEFFSIQQHETFMAHTIGLYPGENTLKRTLHRSLKILEAWCYGLPRHPMLLRRFQQLTMKKRTQIGGFHLPLQQGRQQTGRALSLQQRIDRFLNLYYTLRYQPQCVHVHFGFNALDWVPVKQTLGSQLRLVVSFLGRDVTMDPQEDPEMYRELFEVGDVFLASSPYLRNLAMQLGCPAEKIHVHPVEIDTGFFQPRPTPREPGAKRIILSVGRLVWEKDYETSLQAIALLKELLPDQPFEYGIVGDGPEMDKLQKRARELNLETTIKFHGARDREWIVEKLWESDILLITSVSEGLGAAVLEAGACGLPVVATNVGGLPMTVQEGITGFLVEPRAPEATAEALARLLLDPALRRAFGLAARQFVETHYSADVLYPRLLDYYDFTT